MSEAMNIARPYAKAAFSFANEAGDIALWSAALQTLSIAVADLKMQSALSNPAVSWQEAADLLCDTWRAVVKNGTETSGQSIDNFVRLLAENKRLFTLPAIAQLFQADVAKSEGYIELTVTSAFALTEQQRQQVERKMAQRLNSDVKIVYQEDANLIGGVVVRSEDWVLDDSIRGKLERLQSALI